MENTPEQPLAEEQLLEQAGHRVESLLARMNHDLVDMQRRAQRLDPLRTNPAAQAEAGLALYKAAIDAAMRVAENLDPVKRR
jgi:hypothetical protein